MTGLVAVSAFAGVGGIDLGLTRAGITVRAAVEIDAAARGVLSEHFPETALFEDIREVTGGQLRQAGFPSPGSGLLAGGWPCQDHSVAGRRQGLAGARSGLFAELVRLTRELRPRWLLFENVFGVLSSGRGQDMGRVLRSVVNLGYGVSWRVLDARYFGVAQRRRRVFFVGCLGSWAHSAQVLFEPESSGGGSSPRRPARPSPARASAQGTTGCRAYGLTATDPDVAGPLGAPSTGGHRVDLDSAGAYVTGVLGGIAHTLTSEGHDASEDGTGRGVPIVTYPMVVGRDVVRRLTPRECERLQGFPDDWTRVCQGRPQTDTARYRQIGNAAPPPLAGWCARRIAAVEAGLG